MKIIIMLMIPLSLSFSVYAKEYDMKDLTFIEGNILVDSNDQPIIGMVKSYYKNGNLQRETNFKNGKVVILY